MAGDDQIFVLRFVRDRSFDRVRATLGGNAVYPFESNGERRAAKEPAEPAIFLRNHGNTQFADTVIGQGHVYDATTMMEHVIDALSGDLFGGETKKAIVFRS